MKNNRLLGLVFSLLLLAGCTYDGKPLWSDELYESVSTEVKGLLEACDASGGGYVAVEVQSGRCAVSNVVVRDSSGQYSSADVERMLELDYYRFLMGDLFAPVLLTAALNERCVDTSMLFSTNRFAPDAQQMLRDGVRVDSLTMREALAMCSHAAYADLGFRFRDSFAGDIRTAVSPLFPTKDRSLVIEMTGSLPDDTAFFRFCIGGESRMSVMGVVAFYNALARGGVPIEPFPVPNNAPTLPGKPICSREVAAQMTSLLQGVGVYGPAAHALQELPFAVAGKTAFIPEGYDHCGRTYMVGYFPADNPKWTLLLYMDDTERCTAALAATFARVADAVMAEDNHK